MSDTLTLDLWAEVWEQIGLWNCSPGMSSLSADADDLDFLEYAGYCSILEAGFGLHAPKQDFARADRRTVSTPVPAAKQPCQALGRVCMCLCRARPRFDDESHQSEGDKACGLVNRLTPEQQPSSR